ncbi:MAG: TonB-dependent receptor [Acidobacteriota bacterium]
MVESPYSANVVRRLRRSGILVAIMAGALAISPILVAAAQAQATDQATEDAKKAADAKKEADEKAAAAAKQAEETPQVNEEITVTARKREENIQSVPFSVAAPGEETLRNRGADNIEGVAANVVGLTVQNLGPGQSQVALRGVSAGQIVRDQPGVKEQVGIYLDESVISLSLFTPDIDLFDISRVEVLRGPQGTLFGSGSLTGTVRYISNQPELGKTDGAAELTLNDSTGGEVGGGAKVVANAALGDKAALRVAAYYSNNGGYIDAVQPNLSVKKNVNSNDRKGARVALRFQPNDGLTITPRLVYQEVTADGWNRRDVYNILANPYTTTRPAVHLGEWEQFTQIAEPFTDKFTLGDLNINYKISDAMNFTSVTSYSDRKVLVVRDATALTASITGGSIGLPPAAYNINAPLDDKTTAKMFTQEVRLAGENQNVNWLGGAFYSDIKREYGQSLFVNGFENVSGIPTAGHFGAGKDILFFSDLSYKFKQFALFGEGTIAITDKFDLTGGLRYYDFKEDRTQVFDGIFADPASKPGTTKANGVVPRLIASYKVSSDTSINAQISKGFRLGGINDQLNVPLCTAADLAAYSGHDNWKNETAWNYEVGTKSRVGRGTVGVSAYYMKINDLQATVTAGSCSSRLVFNVPQASSKGLELELAQDVNSNFDYSLSASFNDSKLDSTVFDTSGHILAGIKKGNRLPTVPKLQVQAAATYQHTIGTDLLGYLTGSYQHVGSRFTQIGDQAAGFGTVDLNSFAGKIGGPFTQSTFTFDPELPAYDIFNLRFGVLINKWEFALFVNNVSDKQALLALDQERGTRARVAFLTNTPRTFGLTTRLKF